MREAQHKRRCTIWELVSKVQHQPRKSANVVLRKKLKICHTDPVVAIMDQKEIHIKKTLEGTDVDGVAVVSADSCKRTLKRYKNS